MAQSYRQSIAYFKAHGVRVVNMSWGWNAKELEGILAANGIGTHADERAALAQRLFDAFANALCEEIRDAPDILFVPAAGNSRDDASFSETVPGSIDLPNVLTAGAVDRAGDMASFTSTGPTVRVYTNGVAVESFVPGGNRVPMSGTSLAAPQVTNLAAKLFALDPSLTVAEVVQLILDGAERSEDGRRNLIHPRRSIELLEQREGSHGRVASNVAATGGDPGRVPPRFPIRDFFANPERGYFRLSDDGSRLAFMQPDAHLVVAARGGCTYDS